MGLDRRHTANHGNVRNVAVMLFALFLLLVAQTPVAGTGTGAPYPVQDQVNNDDELVYLAPSGVIKVFDPTVATGEPEVKWQSPSGGWSHIALGDFNADGDAEIVAISRSDTNRLAIFDPVAEGLEPGDEDGVINGIPWKLLHEQPLTGVLFSSSHR